MIAQTAEKKLPVASETYKWSDPSVTRNGKSKPIDPTTIDWDAIITEDDTPVENYDTEQHGGLLTDSLYDNWTHSVHGNHFIAAADVGVFFAPNEPPIVPDIFLSLGLLKPANRKHKRNRSYFVWEVGKVPDVVIEIVSNNEGGEDTTKMARYARLEIPYYAIFDPEHELSDETLRFYVLRGRRYVEIVDTWMPEVELGLILWEGIHQGVEGIWLRWSDKNGTVIPTGAESRVVAQELAEEERIRAEEERIRAQEEHIRAQEEYNRAEQEKARAERLADRLRELGITEVD